MLRHRLALPLLLTALLIFVIAFLPACSRSRHFALGQRLEHMGRYADALGAYEAALAQTPPQAAQERSQIYFRMGECLVRADRMPEAFRAFQSATEANPANAAAHVRLGQFMVSAGLAKLARDQAEIAIRMHPADGDAEALLGTALAKMGEVESAKSAYQKALALDPRQPEVAIALADLYNGDDQTRQAREVLEKSARTNPKSPFPLLALARLHEQEGEISGAENSYRAAVRVQDTPETNLRLAEFLQRTSRIAEAEQVLRRADAQHPSDATALADFQLLAGRPASALSSYEAALTRQQQSAPRKKDLQPDRARVATRIVEADLDVASHNSGAEQDAALQRAHAHLAQYHGDLDQATKAILEAETALAENNLPLASGKAAIAVSLAPDSAAALYTLGTVRLRCSDPAGAREQWLKALDQDVHFGPARLALASMAIENGDSAGAEKYVVAVVRDEPGNIEALTVFARVLAAEKRYASAQTIARRIAALDSSSPVPHLLIGQMALATDHVGDALIQYEQAILVDPHSSEAIDGLTRVYRTGKITRPMLDQIERVAAASPPSPVLMEIAGRLFADHGWYRDAERCLRSALRMDPKRKTAAATLADVFAALGDLPAAADSAAQTGGNAAALLAGLKAQQQNDLGDAIANYERAVRGGETSGVAANNLAWLYAQQGSNLHRALELAQAAESLSPANPAVLDTVGVVRLRRREYSEAIKVLEAAKRLARQTPAPELMAQIREHLAEAYRKAGRSAAAIAIATE